MNWFDGMKPEELPGDLQLVARECGMEVALKLAERMGGVGIYVRPLDSLISSKKKEFVRRHFDGANHKELAITVHWSERYIYEILAEKKDDRQQSFI